MILQTEQGDFMLKEISRHENFIFCHINNTGLLCRVLAEREMDDRAPEALLKIEDKTERLIIITSQFSNAEDAFACIKFNSERTEQFISAIESSILETKKKSETEQQPKVVCYDYLFNYFGKDTFQNKIINGASVSVAFRPYKQGKLVRFIEEPRITLQQPSRLSDKPIISDYWLCNMVDVSFDRDTLVQLYVDEGIKQLFLQQFEWDNITLQIVGYELDYEESEFVSAPMSVSKTDWKQFLRNHLDDFDILDNRHAQCPSYSWVDK